MADLPNPSDLTDEELDKLLETGELPDPEEKTTDEPKPKEGEETEEEEVEEQEEKKPKDDEGHKPEETEEDNPDKPKKDDEPKPPSRREQMRIRQLLEKYGDPEKPTEKPKASGIDYEKELDADEDTKKKLNEDRQQAADAGYDRGLEQAKSIQFHTRLEIDAPRVEEKYPQLDKNSSEFKPEAANDVNTFYLNLVGYNAKDKTVKNADIRYGDFVEAIFTLANDLAHREAQEITKEVKRKAAQTGLRPDGSSGKKLNLNQEPGAMSDEELDAYLAQAIPSR